MPKPGKDDEVDVFMYRCGDDVDDDDDGETEQSRRTAGTAKALTIRQPYAWAVIGEEVR